MKGNWDKMRLDEFVRFQRGFDLPIDNFVNGTVPVYGSTSILGFHNVAKVKAPGVITGRSGTLGRFQYANKDFWPHNTSLWVKDFKGNIPKFAYYIMQCLDFADLNGGGAVPTLNRNVLKSFIVDIPPLPTQQKIAKILSAYDDLIENNLQRIKLLEELALITFEEWFVRMKFPGYKTALFDKETRMPMGWKHLKVKDIAVFQNGYAFYTKGYSTKGYPVIDLGNISEFGDLQITGNEKLISEELYKTSTKFQLQKNDIVMAMTDVTSALRILAKSGIIDKDNTYVLNQRVGMFRPKTKDIDYVFLYALLNDRRLIGKMKAVSKGAVQFYFNTKDIVNYMTFLPKKSIIDEFVKIYKPILELRIKLKEQNQHLKEARDILLPRLMTGMIDVSEIDTELSMAAEDEVEYEKMENI